MVARHLEHGIAAEALAARYLERQGLRLITSNFRAKGGELDLIMTDRQVLVIVEVRSRSRADFVTPGATITRGKQGRLIRTTRFFLLRYRQFANWPVRFDVVEVTGELAAAEIRWSSAAFTLDDMAAG